MLIKALIHADRPIQEVLSLGSTTPPRTYTQSSHLEIELESDLPTGDAMEWGTLDALFDKYREDLLRKMNEQLKPYEVPGYADFRLQITEPFQSPPKWFHQ